MPMVTMGAHGTALLLWLASDFTAPAARLAARALRRAGDAAGLRDRRRARRAVDRRRGAARVGRHALPRRARGAGPARGGAARRRRPRRRPRPRPPPPPRAPGSGA